MKEEDICKWEVIKIMVKEVVELTAEEVKVTVEEIVVDLLVGEEVEVGILDLIIVLNQSETWCMVNQDTLKDNGGMRE